MPAWATVVLTLGSVLLGGVIGIAGAFLQMRHTTAERRASERRERIENGAAAAGPISALLSDASPLPIMVNRGDMTLPLLDSLGDRWKALRDPLMVYAAAHPSADVRRLAGELVAAVPNSLLNTRWAVHTLDRDGGREVTDAAKRSHAKAVALADELMDAIREDRGVA